MFGVFSEYGPVDKLKKNDLLYGIIIISIVGGHFYDGKTERTNPDGNLGYSFYDSTGSVSILHILMKNRKWPGKGN